MLCPRCKDDMQESSVEDINIHECPTCRAMWFESGQLDDVKDEVLPEVGWLDMDTWFEQAEIEARKGLRVCPRCRNTFMTTLRDRQSETEIDICEQCNGSWLATGQFLMLINTMLDEVNQKTLPEYARISLQKARDLLTSSDSPVTNWRDLKAVLKLLRHRIFIQHPKLKSLLVGLQKSLPL